MAHLNLYIPDKLAAEMKRKARSAGVPLSRFVLMRLRDDSSASAWPKDFFEKRCGFLKEDMKEPADAPPEPLDASDLP
jgi:hypothetical protein